MRPTPRSQAISDLIESIALQQTALSHILNAEGEKLQKVLSLEEITPEDMLISKLSTQKMIDAGKHKVLVYLSLVILVLTMISYLFLETRAHLLIAGFFFGVGYGILQPLFQSFVTGTTPAPKRGVANATYMLSYDIGIGIGSLLMGCLQETIGLSAGFSWTAIAYLVGGLIYIVYVDRYYRTLKNQAV